jgi:transcriptional regulator with XRE-family HTH domain
LPGDLRFVEIQTRLLSRIRHLIRNGELTERGFARITGISQPHIHKVLKGTRSLSTARFDLLLRALNCSLLDLVDEDELKAHLAWEGGPAGARVEIPLYQAVLGPGAAWTPERAGQERYLVPCSLLCRNTRLAAVRLKEDPSMLQTLGNCIVAVLDLTGRAPGHPTALYAVDRGRDTVLRRVRRGSGCLYLVSDESGSEPLRWEMVPALDLLGRPAIRGRVVWLSEQQPRKPPRRELAHACEDATSWYVSST